MHSRHGAVLGLLCFLAVLSVHVRAERSHASLLAELSYAGTSMEPFYRSMQEAQAVLNHLSLSAGELVKAYTHVANTAKVTTRLASIHGDAEALQKAAEDIQAKGDHDRALDEKEHTVALEALAEFVRKALAFGECSAPTAPAGTDREISLEEQACSLSHVDCENGSEMDKNRCRCRCGAKTLWHGVFCQACEKTDEDCNHGKLVKEDNKCECTCEPAEQWKGRTCDVCHLTDEKCGHGKADNGLCACVCDEPWATGDSFACNKCAITDDHCNGRGEGKPSEECSCSCNKEIVKVRAEDGSEAEKNRWKGRFCEECNLTAADCNGQNFDESACRCTCKEGQWAGVTCSQCVVTEDRCSEGKGKLNKDKCDCSTDCPAEYIPSEEASFAPTDIFCENCHLKGSECKHNCVLNVRKCTCETTTADPWSGLRCETCDKANNKCAHGEWSDKEDECECVCPTWKSPEGSEFKLWFGALCETCVADNGRCMNGGRVDPATCKCIECSPGWKGDHCHECALTAADCKHNSKFNEAECRCECDEKGHWSNDPAQAPTCSFCPEDAGAHLCENGGEWDAESCSCIECDDLWQGNSCEVCKAAECQNGGSFSMENCRCENCAQWTGPHCEICPLTQAMCHNGGQLNKESCDCHDNCPEKWRGSLHCDACVVATAEKAAGVGTRAVSVNPTTCTPVCKHPWGNPAGECKQCTASCQHGGHVTTDSETKCECQGCARGWGGQFCDECTLQRSDCHASRTRGLDTRSCTCTCKNSWTSGQTCEVCNMRSCHNGWADHNNCKCHCHPGAKGPQCNQCRRCVNGTCSNGRCQCNTGTHYEILNKGRADWTRSWYQWTGVSCEDKRVVRQVRDDPHVDCPGEASKLLDAPGDTRLSVFTKGEDKIEVHQYNAHNTELVGYGLSITMKQGEKTTTTKISARVASKGLDGTKEIECCLNGDSSPGACVGVPNLDANSLEHEFMLHQQRLLNFIAEGSQLTVDSTAAETYGYTTESICSKDSALLGPVKEEDSPFHGCGWKDHMDPPGATPVNTGDKNALVEEFAGIDFKRDMDYRYIVDNFDKGLVCKGQTGLDDKAKDVILQKCLNDMPVRHRNLCRKINPTEVNNFDVGCQEAVSFAEAIDMVKGYLSSYKFKCGSEWQWRALWTCFDGGCEAAARKDMTDMADIREAAMASACVSPQSGEAMEENARTEVVEKAEDVDDAADWDHEH